MSRIRFRTVPFAALGALLTGCVPVVHHKPAPSRVIVVSRDEDQSRLRVPPGHYPRPGECRLWFPGRPPGHQPKSQGCRGIERIAPAGSWILYRPGNDKKVVHARVIDPKRDGVVVVVRVYDADRGTYLGQERRR